MLQATMVFTAGSALVAGIGLFVFTILSTSQNLPERLLGRYIARLERHVGFLLLPRSATWVVRVQIVVFLFLLVASTLSMSWLPLGLAAIVAAAPVLVLSKWHRERVSELEGQLDTWLLMLANALKATPSVGEAIRSTIALVPPPFSDEIDLLVKELKLGAPLDRAIRASARRINSTVISSAFATIVVARKTGGDLPSTLEQASAALREAARLEGVLRTKTAEGRGQVLVLASVPFVLCIMIAWLDRSWFDPMLGHPLGQGILVACALAWLVATVWAHQIAKGGTS